MKFMIALGLVGLSFSAYAEKVDYKYCRDAFTPEFQGGYIGPDSDEMKGYPFKIEDNGKITPHKSADYKFDKESNTETLTFEMKNPYGGDKVVGKSVIVIKRDKKGNISQVTNTMKNPGVKTRSGLGQKFPGGGMYGPGIPGGGFGYPGVGIGGGFGYNGPSEFTTVTDVKIKAGKCFPYRSVNMNTLGNNTHHSFGSDVAMCRDLADFYKGHKGEDSKLGKLKACYESYQKEAQKVINGHLKRNDDLYNPKSEDDALDAWGSGGFFGTLEDGEFSDGTAAPKGGYGGYGAGGFGMSIDNIVQNQMFNSAEKVKMLSQYCSFPYGPMKDMIKDDDLFKKEVVADADAGGEGSGGGVKEK